MANTVDTWDLRINGAVVTVDGDSLRWDVITGLTTIDGVQAYDHAGIIWLSEGEYIDVAWSGTTTGLQIPSFKLVKVTGTTYGG